MQKFDSEHRNGVKANQFLSSCVKRWSQFCDFKRINLVDKDIRFIDQVSEQFKNVIKLYLSHNQISDISQLQQFPKLKALSLSYNQIQKLEDLKVLGCFRFLDTLSLEGNPVQQMQGYKQTVVQYAPLLKRLDGKEIYGIQSTSQERFIEMIILNELEAAKLSNLADKLQVHLELINQNKIQKYKKLVLQKWKQGIMLKWPQTLEAQVKMCLEQRVGEILTIHPTKNKNFAYQECLLAQQKQIHKLNNLCLQHAADCNAAFGSIVLQQRLIVRQETHLSKLDQYETFDIEEEAQTKLTRILKENNQLKQKLFEFQNQNRENVILAEAKLKNLANKLQTTQKDQYKIQMQQKQQIQHFQKELAYAKRGSSMKTLQMHTMIDEGIIIVVDKFHALQLKKKTLKSFYLNYRRQSAINQFATQSQHRRLKEKVILAFIAWKWNSKTENFIKFKVACKEHDRIKILFRGWQRYIKDEITLRKVMTQKYINLIQKCLKAWSIYPLLKSENLQNRMGAQAYYEINLAKRVFNSFCVYYRVYLQPTIAINREIQENADNFYYNKLIKSTFDTWKQCYLIKQTNIQALKVFTGNFYQRLLKHKAFKALRQYINEKIASYKQCFIFNIILSKFVKLMVFKQLKNFSKHDSMMLYKQTEGLSNKTFKTCIKNRFDYLIQRLSFKSKILRLFKLFMILKGQKETCTIYKSLFTWNRFIKQKINNQSSLSENLSFCDNSEFNITFQNKQVNNDDNMLNYQLESNYLKEQFKALKQENERLKNENFRLVQIIPKILQKKLSSNEQSTLLKWIKTIKKERKQINYQIESRIKRIDNQVALESNGQIINNL